MWKRSISTKIVALMSIILTIVCSCLGIIAYYNIYDSLTKNTEEMLPKLAVEAARIIEARISNQFIALEALAVNEKISSFNSSQEQGSDVTALLNQEIMRLGHKRMAIIDIKGNAIYNDGQKVNLKDRAYFQKAIKGEEAVSDPIISKVDNTIVMVYAVPIKSGNTIVGVLIATRDGYELSNLAKEITVGKTGNAFVVNAEGKTIAHSDKELLDKVIKTNNENVDAVSSASKTQESIQSELGYKNYDTIQKQMKEGKTGFGEYEYNNTPMFLGFSPISGDGWSVAVQAESAELLSGLSILKRNTIIASLAFLLTSFAIVYFFTGRLTKHLKKLKYYTGLLGEFNLDFEISEDLLKQKDEIGDLSNSFKKFTTEVRGLIREVRASIIETSNAAANIFSSAEATGKSAEQIAKSSSEVASGTSRQIEHFETVMGMINRNNEDVKKGFEIVGRTLENARSSTMIAESGKSSIIDSINDLKRVSIAVESATSSIQNLENRSNEIGKIVSIITGIASQTNLLSLNASIEAARAGAAGRGFAVVADEIRKLAEESGNAAKNIRNLIKEIQAETNTTVQLMEGNLEQVHLQVDKIKVGGESLEQIVNVVINTEEHVSEIYEAFTSTQTMSKNMVDAITEISSIVEEAAAYSEQVASSTQEQSAAVEDMVLRAEELLTLSQKLKGKIDVFKVE